MAGWISSWGNDNLRTSLLYSYAKKVDYDKELQAVVDYAAEIKASNKAERSKELLLENLRGQYRQLKADQAWVANKGKR